MVEKYVQLVRDMYEGSETAVRCAVETTESFKVKVGPHQGSVLSSFLFAVIIDRLTDEVRGEQRIDTNGRIIVRLTEEVDYVVC